MWQRRTDGTLWIRSAEMLLGVSFGTCLRRCGDILMGRQHYILLRSHHYIKTLWRRLGDVPPRRCWVFHFRCTGDVAGTTRETSLHCCYNVLLRGGYVTISLMRPLLTCSIWFTYLLFSVFAVNYHFFIGLYFSIFLQGSFICQME